MYNVILITNTNEMHHVKCCCGSLRSQDFSRLVLFVSSVVHSLWSQELLLGWIYQSFIIIRSVEYLTFNYRIHTSRRHCNVMTNGRTLGSTALLMIVTWQSCPLWGGPWRRGRGRLRSGAWTRPPWRGYCGKSHSQGRCRAPGRWGRGTRGWP